MILTALAFMAFILWYFLASRAAARPNPAKFSGQRAYADVLYQTSLGPRTPGSAAHAQVVEWLRRELQAAGWQVQIQNAQKMGHPIQNVIARRLDVPPQIVLAAHYDSRLYADRDPNPVMLQQPVPGANDGASGVAVLLELARTLPADSVPVWLVFFDAEDNGRIEGWDWVLGSRAFVETYPLKPKAVVVVDMVGDPNLNIYLEKNSDQKLAAEIWATAASLGYANEFIPTPKYAILDDHVPFLEAGIPAVDIIDIEYPYYHTTSDTADKISSRSLKVVGQILLTWVTQQNRQP